MRRGRKERVAFMVAPGLVGLLAPTVDGFAVVCKRCGWRTAVYLKAGHARSAFLGHRCAP